ncbi:hypothetical protein IscW_ISCW013956, partial [Ixodes scapularis]
RIWRVTRMTAPREDAVTPRLPAQDPGAGGRNGVRPQQLAACGSRFRTVADRSAGRRLLSGRRTCGRLRTGRAASRFPEEIEG